MSLPAPALPPQAQPAWAAPLPDQVPDDSPGAMEIGFSIPRLYNAASLLFARAESPDLALICGEARWSYADLCRRAAQWSEALTACGLEPGDRVLVVMDDTPECPAVIFGAMAAGFVPVITNTLSPPDLVRFYAEDAAARVAVLEAALAPALTTAEGLGGLGLTLFTNDQADAALARHPGLARPIATDRDAMAFWMYSSGSTGRPKGIVHLHHDLLYTAQSYARHVLDLKPGDLCFSIPKIFFAYGFGNSLTFPFAAGAASLLLPGRPLPAAIFQAIRRHRPTVLFALPTLYTALTAAPEARDADLSSLRLCISAAEILAGEVAASWQALSGLPVVEGLGSTEVLHIYLSNRPEQRRAGSAGLRVPGYEIALKHELTGAPVADGEEGILWVRGHSCSPCYWNRPDKTAETMREGGWICTNDRFTRDAEGFHYFKGRADDLVKVSGQWVHPLEVELCLADHPAVLECAVLALARADQRMVLAALVATRPGEAWAPQALQDWVKQKLLPYKYPRLVAQIEACPKTGTGKIDRQAVKRIAQTLFQAELEAPHAG